jgi:dTDP-4-dehydrorhamnose reductase
MKKRILITGVNGMLGSFVVQEFKKNDATFDVYGVGRSKTNGFLPGKQYYELDLLNFTELKRALDDVDPDIIIHCAAEVNLDICERDNAYANQIHRDVTSVLASRDPAKTKLIYISTDSVFDGIAGNYSEEDKVHPLNFYAMSKFNGEEAVRARQENYLILRTNIYGFRKNKGNSLFEWIAGKLSSGETITGFDDLVFNPLYTGQLASLMSDLLKTDYCGTLNAGCNEFISKYQFAVDVANEFGWDTSLIKRGNSDQFPAKLERPKNTTLNTNKLRQIAGYVPTFKSGIKQLFTDFQNK